MWQRKLQHCASHLQPRELFASKIRIRRIRNLLALRHYYFFKDKEIAKNFQYRYQKVKNYDLLPL